MATFFATDDASFDAALALAAGNGPGVDTINLAAGTYSAAHTISTAVIVNGAKAGQSGDAAGRGFSESTLSGGLQINAAGVTIDGVQVTGLSTFSGALTGFPSGIYVTGTGATIQNAKFLGTTGGGASSVGVMAGGTATGLTATHNAFSGYDNGIYVVESATGSINTNVFSQVSGGIGVFTESTGVVISTNTFSNDGGAGASVFSTPAGSIDVSTFVLANNIVPSILPSHAINIEARGAGALTVTGTSFDDAIYTADYPSHPVALMFRGLGGSDAIWGGDGNDTIDGGTGNDFLNGKAGTNTVSYADATGAVTVSLAVQDGVVDGNDLPTATQDTGGAGIDALVNFQNLTGSTFGDILTGDGNANVITGGTGVDTINGAGGNDILVVNAGDAAAGETYNGGANTDTLGVTGDVDFAGSALLSIEALTFATTGTSTATFTSSQIGGANLSASLAVTGDGFTNKIVINMNGVLLDLSGWTFGTWVAADTITINGTPSADTITGSSRNDIITGGQNNDAINGGAGDDTINYAIGDGSDAIDGGSGGETTGDTLAITGTSGNDTLAVVVVGSTILSMAAGTVANIERVTLDLDGGSGDTLDYSGSTAVTVNLSTTSGTGFTSIANVENVIGGAAADSLTGDGNANVLDGAGNDDTLIGLGGMDTLLGSIGNDTLVVNAGDAVAGETYDGGGNTDTLRVTGTANFTGSSLISLENLTFATSATSTVTLTSSQIGGPFLSATLVVTGDAQINSLAVNMTGTSLDLSGWTFATWTAGTDTITVTGTSAGDTITGSSQNDNITGGTGLDVIHAGAGDDTLVVAASDAVAGETYDGGANNDTLKLTGTGASDFTGSSLQSIENLLFATSGTSTATFTSGQIGGANLSSTLAVTGDGFTNNIVINMTGTLLDLSGWTFGIWTAGADTIAITGSSSGDTITGSSQNDIINGGLGNDTINAGTGDDRINYVIGGGADSVDGGGNTGAGDTLAVTGTAGNDTLAVVMTGGTIVTLAGGTVANIEHVTLDLGAGNGDTLDYTGSSAVVVNLPSLSATGFDSIMNVENVTGGSGADALTGDAANNTLDGGTNDDLLIGHSGVDTLLGGSGNDAFVVNAGDTGAGETYNGGADTDTLRITGTVDFTGVSLLSLENLTFLTTGTSTVTLTSGQIGGTNLAATLAVTGDAQINRLAVNMTGTSLDLSGWTFVSWTAGTDTITVTGTSAGDTITGSSQNDVINGGLGDDSISSGSGDDTINYLAGSGADVVDGGTNTGTGDTLAIGGTSGADTLGVVVVGGVVASVAGGTVVNIEHVTLDLGAGGGDLLDYTGTAQSVTVNLTTASATGFDSIAGIEAVTGGSGDDTLTGNASANGLRGGAGNDTLVVNAGDAAAGETYDGGANTDTLQVNGTSAFTGAALLSIEKLTFATSGASTVTLTSSQIGGANLAATLAVTGDSSTNNIVVNMTGTSVNLGGWTFAAWTAGTDTLTVNGTAAAETITGSVQNDVINAGAGVDVIVAGSGNDKINSGAGADTATGGTGVDLFVFDAAALTDAQSGLFDRITDYDQSAGAFNAGEGDQLDLSAILATAYNNGSGQPVASLVRVIASGTGASLQIDADGTANGTNWITIARLDGVHAGNSVNVVLSPTLPAGTSITVGAAAAPRDLDMNGASDILWRDNTGVLGEWQMSGGQRTNSIDFGTIPTAWHIDGTGDFNADGTSDLLWRNDDGSTGTWFMRNGQHVGGTDLGNISANWHVTGTGDYNGDGTNDILWRDDGGATGIWLMRNGQRFGAVDLGTIPTSWHVDGPGDFNGDGTSDILWRNNDGSTGIWFMQNGQHLGGTDLGNIPANWHVRAVGDFNADGISDLLWRDENGGATGIWFMQNGQHMGGTDLGAIPTTWHVDGTGDFNADGTTDIQWRNDNGTFALWLMNGGQRASSIDFGVIPTFWSTQPHFDFF